MNINVVLLFVDVLITMLCVAGIVLWILRREYLPVIRNLERKNSPVMQTGDEPAHPAATREAD